jgi:hypothetical protein
MREIKRTHERLIPTYRGSYSAATATQTWPQLGFGLRFWWPVFALLRVSFPRIYLVVTFR